MKAVNPKSTYEYILKSERQLPREEQTIFICSYLTLEQEAYLDDNIGYQADGGFNLTIGKSNMLALHFGLKDIINMPDSSGETVKLKRDETVRKDGLPNVGRPWLSSCLNAIPKEARDELASAIKSSSELTEQEIKN